jgi:hypothetical protein
MRNAIASEDLYGEMGTQGHYIGCRYVQYVPADELLQTIILRFPFLAHHVAMLKSKWRH